MEAGTDADASPHVFLLARSAEMPQTAASTVQETLQEYANNAGEKPIVDTINGVISGVKLLGPVSKNGRVYTKECIANAAGKYESAKVNVNHLRGKAGGPRDYQDRIGSIKNVVVKESGLYGDLHYNPKHALSDQLAWDAIHAPENVGFSHSVEAMTSRREDTLYVESIERVLSVDIVADPATTNGIFEALDTELPTDPEQRTFCEHGLSAVSDARTILLCADDVATKRKRLREVVSTWRSELREGEISDKITQDATRCAIRQVNCTAENLIYDAMYDDEAYPSVEAKKLRMLSVLADWESELTKLSSASVPNQEAVEMAIDWKELNIESLKENRQDLYEALTGTDAKSKLEAEAKTLKEAVDARDAELKATKDRLAVLEAAKAEADRKAAIVEELKASKLDMSNKTLVSDAFMETLNAAPDAEARKRLIEDRVNLSKSFTASIGTPPFATVGDTKVVTLGATASETLARL